MVVFLLLGAIVNVGVASGMRLWSDLRRQGSTVVTLDDVPGELLPEILWTVGLDRWYARIMLVGTGIEETWFMESNAAGDFYYFSPLTRFQDRTSHRFVSVAMLERQRRLSWIKNNWVEVRVGWPARSFIGRHSSLHFPYTNTRTYEGAIRLPDWIIQATRGRSRFDLPIKPIWFGFAVNTIFYAVMVWLLALGPFAARRVIRSKRGCCIRCGYDLRGSSGGGGEVCPECGWRRGEGTLRVAR